LAVLSLPEPSRSVLPQLATWGLVDKARFEGGQVVLTQRGRLMADAVVKELLAVA
jgi:oxygen-independent coproporphyrinogen-3 oxidase